MTGSPSNHQTRRSGRAGRVALSVAAVGAVVWLLVAVQVVAPASGAYFARLTNTTNTTATNPYFTCRAAVVGEAATNAYVAYPMGEPSGTTATDVSGNAHPGLYTPAGITYNQPGPCPRDTPARTAVTLNGSIGYLSGPATAQTGPNTFSIEIWFRTTIAGGKLIGFGNLLTGPSTNYDRHLYIDTGGLLVFGVYPNAVKTISSTTTVADGRWHHAIGTLSAAGQMLYLDGQLVATNTGVTTAQTFTGYWRIGYDNLTGWTNAPTNAFFTGSLAWAATYPYALTGPQVAAHRAAGL